MAVNAPSPVVLDRTPPTILLVEGDGLVRSPLAEYLRLCGYRVLEAVDAAEAKALLSTDPTGVNLVFTDAELAGEENGFALAIWVRRHAPEVKVLLTAGLANAAQRAGEVCEDGPALAKPYSEAVMLARIQRLLHAARRHDPLV